MFTRPVPQSEKEYEPEVELDLSLYELMRAFREIVANYDAQEVREIDPEEFTIEEKITSILAIIKSQKQVAFSELFSQINIPQPGKRIMKKRFMVFFKPYLGIDCIRGNFSLIIHICCLFGYHLILRFPYKFLLSSERLPFLQS